MKISFCTTCKGRLHHLARTLPINLINSSSYRNKEFIILDYNSKDGLFEWAKNSLKYWMDRGIVKYYYTRIPQFFIATHAKNIAYKQATGDIICNLDADNFIMENFCEYLNNTFLEPNVIFCSSSIDRNGNGGVCGKIACLQKHFYNVGGYDEGQNLGWGWDDVNFRFRAETHNQLKRIIGNMKWNLAIDHSNTERVKNFQSKNIIETKEWSEKRLLDIYLEKEYIANKGKNWGYIEDLKRLC